MMEKKRIEYIDLMKGICIFLVVLLHCDFQFEGKLSIINSCLGELRMPLYFFLSGFFFKTYSNLFDFVLHKTNNLIIPYIFFLTLFILPYCVVVLPINSIKTLVLYYVEPFYPALWFLRCLFFLNLFYYVIYKNIYSDINRVIMSFIISISIFYISVYLKQFDDKTYMFWFLYISNLMPALFALPLVAIANFVRKKNNYLQNLRPAVKLYIMVFLILLWGVFSEDNIGYSMLNLGSNPLFTYLASLSGIGTIYFLSGMIKRIPYFSYIGRYSLIVLGTHMIPIIIINKYFNVEYKLLTACITLAIMPFFIFILKKYFPYFTAQKQLIYLKNNKICFLKE